ncbi:MAG: class I SAM-dependent methyltransferase [Deltaproteobacteria bacterium]|nr:class I SAM-dependent methyltransferase [Deltaproteobacteria bacterium]
MSRPEEFSFTRYLAAKRGLDDRSLNRHVFNSLSQSLSAFSAPGPLQVLEVGCGLGAMVERLLDWGLLRRGAVYKAIDLQPENIAAARERLRAYAASRGYRVSEEEGVLCLKLRQGQRLFVVLEAIDLYDFIRREQGRQTWDLLIAHAFLDLVDLSATLPPLLSLLGERGLCYFTLNFDGATIFLPYLDVEFDRQIEELYHQTMDQRQWQAWPSARSQTGRRLFHMLPAAGAQVLAAGSSDWVVHPGPGGYPADEAYFLHFIIHTVASALQDHPHLPEDRFREWVDQRHRQIEKGQLLYIARQLDFLGYINRGKIGTLPIFYYFFPAILGRA